MNIIYKFSLKCLIYESTLQDKGKIVLQVVEEPQRAEQNNDSEGDSEYEDAEDGIPPANDNSPAQASTDFECLICGELVATKFCKECKDTFCPSCDGVYHKHASRQHHIRTELVTSPVSPPRQQQVASAAPSSTTAAPATVTTQQSHGAAATSVAESAGNETRYVWELVLRELKQRSCLFFLSCACNVQRVQCNAELTEFLRTREKYTRPNFLQ